MSNYHPPKCPHCDLELDNVLTVETSSYTFDSHTGSYTEDGRTGSLESTCPRCGADVYDALEDAPINYQAPEPTPCPAIPATS